MKLAFIKHDTRDDDDEMTNIDRFSTLNNTNM